MYPSRSYFLRTGSQCLAGGALRLLRGHFCKGSHLQGVETAPRKDSAKPNLASTGPAFTHDASDLSRDLYRSKGHSLWAKEDLACSLSARRILMKMLLSSPKCICKQLPAHVISIKSCELQTPRPRAMVKVVDNGLHNDFVDGKSRGRIARSFCHQSIHGSPTKAEHGNAPETPR